MGCYAWTMWVSIHAPREGCDGYEKSVVILVHSFQFTHPGRGATGKDAIDGSFSMVSIHAPREGCDLSQTMI